MSARRVSPANSPWPAPLTRWPTGAWMALVVGLATLVLYGEFPGRPLILHSLQKLAHPVVFGAIAVGVFTLRRRARPGGSVAADYLVASLVALGIGCLTEFGQVLTHRDPSLRDVLLDARGIACALAILSAWDPRRRRDRIGRALRVGLLGLAAAVGLLSVTPVLWTAAAYVQRSLTAPVLFRPASRLDLLLVSLTDVAPELATLPTGYALRPSERALRVPLTTRPYAGVTLDEPYPDWRGMSVLSVDLTNPSHTDLTLHLRVTDRAHDGTYGDRFEGVFTVPAQTRRTVDVPLQHVAHAPADRPLDLGHVTGLSIYKVGGDGPREMWLSGVSLR